MAGFDPMILSRWFKFRVLNNRFHSLCRLEEPGTGALPSTICSQWMGAAIIGKVHWLQSSVESVSSVV